jgi:protein involved in polysaccharide export with SLBB domain
VRPGATPAPLDAPVDPERYVCGPGDVLDLNFWGLQSFSVRVTVDVEGRAFVPKVGYVALEGKTLAQARRLLREGVARYYPALSFDATLAEPRTFMVHVSGAVATPGTYPVQAVERVSALLARAGGLLPTGSRRRIELRRRDGQVVRADLLRYATAGAVDENPRLLDGDVVQVPYEGVGATVAGAVNRPGRYELVGARDLAELIEVAGGLRPDATRLLPVDLVRRLPDDRRELRALPFAPDGAVPAVALERDDAVMIHAVADLERTVTVVGAVNGVPELSREEIGTLARGEPGDPTVSRRVPYVEHDTVRALLERIGGVTTRADLSAASILRGGEAIPVDLEALLVARDPKADRPLQLGDAVIVPFKRRTILVSGAVATPGKYAFNPNFGVQDYVALAGGATRFAEGPSTLRVITPRGESRPAKPDLRLEPGSSVVVPERSFSRAEVVQLVLGAAGILLSGAALIVSIRNQP